MSSLLFLVFNQEFSFKRHDFEGVSLGLNSKTVVRKKDLASQGEGTLATHSSWSKKGKSVDGKKLTNEKEELVGIDSINLSKIASEFDVSEAVWNFDDINEPREFKVSSRTKGGRLLEVLGGLTMMLIVVEVIVIIALILIIMILK